MAKSYNAQAIVMKLAIVAFYAKPGNGAGGLLHLVLDDGNVADEHVHFCQGQANQANDADARAIAGMLLLMSEDRRRWAINEAHAEMNARKGHLPGGECSRCERTAVQMVDRQALCSVCMEAM